MGGALFVQGRDQGLAHAQTLDGLGGVEGRIDAEALRRRLEAALFGRGVGAQGVLDAVAQLGQDAVGNVGRVLGDEIDADALGADQAHDLFDLFAQGVGRVVEQQMGLVEEEDEARLFGVADLGQLFEQFRQQPQQEGGVEARTGHQLRRVQHIDLAAAVKAGAHHVLQPQGRLAEEGLAALLLKLEDGALDRGDGGGGDIADLAADALRILADIGQHGAQVVEVEQQQAFLVRDVEEDRQDPFLDVVEIQHPRQKQGADLADRGADRVALEAVQVPEDDRGRLRLERQAHGGGAGQQFLVGRAGDADARQVALHIGAEDGDAGVGKPLGHDLQGHGLAGPGGAGDHAVAVGAVQQQDFRQAGTAGRGAVHRLAEEDAGGVGHGELLKGIHPVAADGGLQAPCRDH